MLTLTFHYLDQSLCSFYTVFCYLCVNNVYSMIVNTHLLQSCLVTRQFPSRQEVVGFAWIMVKIVWLFVVFSNLCDQYCVPVASTFICLIRYWVDFVCFLVDKPVVVCFELLNKIYSYFLNCKYNAFQCVVYVTI